MSPPRALIHGGRWWRILTRLDPVTPTRFGELFRGARRMDDRRALESTRHHYALRELQAAGMALKIRRLGGYVITAHGVRELARVNAAHDLAQLEAA